MRDTLRIGGNDARFGLSWKLETVALGVRVGRVQQRQIVLVAARDVRREIRFEARHAIVERLREPNERDALMRETPEVHSMTATRAAHRNGDVLAAGLHDLRVPFAEHAQPPAEIATAIGTRRTIMRANRQIDALACTLQLVRDLHAGRSCTHHQHAPFGQLPGIVIVGGMNLHET